MPVKNNTGVNLYPFIFTLLLKKKKDEGAGCIGYCFSGSFRGA